MEELKFGVENLSEKKTKRGFVGEITATEYPVVNAEYPTKQLKLSIEPLSVYEKTQYEWLNTEVSDLNSKWGVFNRSLEELRALPEKHTDLVGKVFEFESVELLVGFDRDTRVLLWKPIRVVKKDEADKLRGVKENSEPIV